MSAGNSLQKSKRKFRMTYSADINELKAHQARNKKEFKPLIKAKMQSIQREPKLIKSFFVGNILF
ncbi:hypothetical protein HYU12_00215 [Candidatus Woesearchaeota archaeon]|nr:hypothetical protein [Candidatus Woesearchaeota archaeon]